MREHFFVRGDRTAQEAAFAKVVGQSHERLEARTGVEVAAQQQVSGADGSRGRSRALSEERGEREVAVDLARVGAHGSRKDRLGGVEVVIENGVESATDRRVGVVPPCPAPARPRHQAIAATRSAESPGGGIATGAVAHSPLVGRREWQIAELVEFLFESARELSIAARSEPEARHVSPSSQRGP